MCLGLRFRCLNLLQSRSPSKEQVTQSRAPARLEDRTQEDMCRGWVVGDRSCLDRLRGSELQSHRGSRTSNGKM